MPIAKVQMPDGKIARFEVPDGTTPEQVTEFASSMPTEPVAENRSFTKSVGENLSQSLQQRGEKIFEQYPQTIRESGNSPAAMAGGLYKTIGQLAGAGSDVLGAGLQVADDALLNLPSSAVKAGVGAAGSLPSGEGKGRSLGEALGETVPQDMAKYQQWASQNPEAAEYAAATGNIASVLPMGRASPSKAAGQGFEEMAKSKLKQEVGKIAAPMVTAKSAEQALKYKKYSEDIFGKPVISLGDKEKRAVDIISTIDAFKTGKADKLYKQQYAIKDKAYQISGDLTNRLKQYDNIKVKKDALIKNLAAPIYQELTDKRYLTNKAGGMKESTDLMYDSFVDAINKNPQTPAGIMQARRDFDSFIETLQPNVFDEGKLTAYRGSKQIIRDKMNDFVAKIVDDPNVKNDLYDSSSLLNAAEKVGEKVASRAGKVASENKSVSDTLRKYAVGALSLGGVGAATAFPSYAAPAAAVGLTGAGLYYGGKFLNKSQTKRIVGKVLQEQGDVLDAAGKEALSDYIKQLELEEEMELKKPAKDVIKARGDNR
jgi:hypothetical protein